MFVAQHEDNAGQILIPESPTEATQCLKAIGWVVWQLRGVDQARQRHTPVHVHGVCAGFSGTGTKHSADLKCERVVRGNVSQSTDKRFLSSAIAEREDLLLETVHVLSDHATPRLSVLGDKGNPASPVTAANGDLLVGLDIVYLAKPQKGWAWRGIRFHHDGPALGHRLIARNVPAGSGEKACVRQQKGRTGRAVQPN